MQQIWIFQERVSQLFESKGQRYATAFSDSDSSSSDLDEGLRLRKGNYSALMTIALMQSSNDLSVLVEELGYDTLV